MSFVQRKSLRRRPFAFAHYSRVSFSDLGLRLRDELSMRIQTKLVPLGSDACLNRVHRPLSDFVPQRGSAMQFCFLCFALGPKSGSFALSIVRDRIG